MEYFSRIWKRPLLLAVCCWPSRRLSLKDTPQVCSSDEKEFVDWAQVFAVVWLVVWTTVERRGRRGGRRGEGGAEEVLGDLRIC